MTLAHSGNNKLGNQTSSNLAFMLIFSALIIFRVWLIAGIPKMILFAAHDDLFYAEAAHNIIHGLWMGPYSQMTLIKGPFYALFLVFSFLTGLPLLINETVFYIIACIILFVALRPIIPNKWWRLVLFIALLFCPVSLPTQFNLRVYREFVNFSLTLFIVAFSLGLFIRLHHKTNHFLLWSIGLGLSTGAFLITREDGMWILPAMFVLLLTSAIILWKEKIDKRWARSGILLLSVLICYSPTLIVSSLNYHTYAYWGVAEILDPDFNRVLTALQKIKEDNWHPAIQVSKEAIEKAYTASPLFSDLKSVIESSWPAYDTWDNLTVGSKPSWYLEKYSDGGAEMSNSHFVWLLRDAVYNSGQVDTSKYPQDFYKQLADQLETACENGSLDCYSTRSLPFVGDIDSRHYPIIGRMLRENFASLIKGNYLGGINLDLNTWPVWPANDSRYEYFEELIYNSTDTRTEFSGKDKVMYVGGSIDLRLKMMSYKGIMMAKLSSLYRILTLPFFVTSLVGWCLLSIVTFVKRKSNSQIQYWLVSTFVLGLLLSRLMTLTIVDATTSMSAMGYGASLYLFIFTFIVLIAYWICVPGRELLVQLTKKKTYQE